MLNVKTADWLSVGAVGALQTRGLQPMEAVGPAPGGATDLPSLQDQPTDSPAYIPLSSDLIGPSSSMTAMAPLNVTERRVFPMISNLSDQQRNTFLHFDDTHSSVLSMLRHRRPISKSEPGAPISRFEDEPVHESL